MSTPSARSSTDVSAALLKLAALAAGPVVSARSSTDVSAALLVTRIGGAVALLELELLAVVSINRSSSGSGATLFLPVLTSGRDGDTLTAEPVEAGGAKFENAVSLPVVSPPLSFFDCCSDS